MGQTEHLWYTVVFLLSVDPYIYQVRLLAHYKTRKKNAKRPKKFNGGFDFLSSMRPLEEDNWTCNDINSSVHRTIIIVREYNLFIYFLNAVRQCRDYPYWNYDNNNKKKDIVNVFRKTKRIFYFKFGCIICHVQGRKKWMQEIRM